MSTAVMAEAARLQQQMADFEQQNPEIAEAIELFGLSMIQYQATLNAISGVQVYVSDATLVRKQEDSGN